jgi:outer membrane receptor protein involved in Fe transport
MRRSHIHTTRAARRRAALSLAALAVVLAAPAAAEPARSEAQPLNIPAGPLSEALVALAAQTNHQLLYAPELARGRQAPALSGRYTPEAALERLLAGGEVEVRRAGPRVLVLRPRTPASAPAAAPPTGLPLRTAPADVPRPFAPEAAPPAARHAGRDPAPTAPAHTVEEVRVTGSNIRGVGRGPAPLLVLDARALEATGRATVAEALQTLPQTFGGESTEGTITTRADRVGSNSAYATSVNLRGLGADATLVLVNGRRLAGAGNKGDFADLSAIPTTAVARVEVLLDGASAVYGSDAVGGVVNVILRRDFDGLEARLRAGTATAGEPREGLAGLVAGRAWDGGGLLLALEAYRRENLPAQARAFARSADLRPFGGADRRESLSFPGNIVRTDPATGAAVPGWAIPPGQDGTALRPGDLVAGQVNLSSPQAGMDLLPDQRRQSAYLAVRQAVRPGLELSADARWSFRKVRGASLVQTSTLTVGRSNPFFVSPTGAASHQIQYSWQGELGNGVATPSSESLSATLGARQDLPAGWTLEGYVAAAQELIESRSANVLNTARLAEALGTDNPLTPYSPAVDGYFNPFAGAPANPARVLDYIGSGWTNIRLRNQVFSASALADGRVLALPGGDLKLALGLQAREETYRRTGANFTSTIAPMALAGEQSNRRMAAAFAEVRAPLAGPANARPGLRALEISAAVRAERYSDFGTAVTPKLGVLWSPAEGLRLRGTWGQSFRAPALTELNSDAVFVGLRFQVGTARLLTLSLNGGNPDLEPETATSATLGLDWEPAFVPGLRLTATGFETRFEARIDRPVLANRATALVDPRLAPFVRRLDPGNAADQALLASYLNSPDFSPSAGVFPPSEYAAIVDIRYVNTGRLDVRGLDLQASYAANLLGGRLALAANASWLLAYEQQLTPTSPAADFAGVAGYPADFRARVSADWSRGDLSAGLALNRLSGFRDGLGVQVDGQTTVDGQLRLRGRAGGRTEGAALTLFVRNLFDADPPFYDNPAGLAFDPASADPIGRFVAVQLTRSW